MTLIQTEPKSIKLWTTDIKKVYLGSTLVRPKPRTFTISWTEQSNMSSGWTYSDDAAWLTAGSWDFDDFFWYSAVLLNTSWVETAEMIQSWGVFTGAMTTLGNITSWDNVMIKFPVRWIKMSKSWSVVTLSITEELNKAWYQYRAFARGTKNSHTIKDNLYIWAYHWSRISGVLKSRSWQAKATSASTDWTSYFTSTTACTTAQANWAWYDNITYFAQQYINCLYMMKYWNPYQYSTVWYWYINWTVLQDTWATNSITNATWATNTSNTWRIKLFWLEDRWGNQFNILNGIAWNDSTWVRVWILPASSSGKISSFEWTVSTWRRTNYMSAIAGDNEWLFLCTADWAVDTYYKQYQYINLSSSSAFWAWASYDAKSRLSEWYGILTIAQFSDNVYNNNRLWARLIYLKA